jgi:hypothetical protein
LGKKFFDISFKYHPKALEDPSFLSQGAKPKGIKKVEGLNRLNFQCTQYIVERLNCFSNRKRVCAVFKYNVE